MSVRHDVDREIQDVPGAAVAGHSPRRRATLPPVKAIEIRGAFGLDSLKLVERSDPSPGRGQLLVRVRAASLNYRDLLLTLGHYNPKLKLPHVPGSDGAGEVVSVGEGVTDAKPGDRVAGTFFQRWEDGELSDVDARTTLGGDRDGMLSELVLLEAGGWVRVPEHLSDAEAATLPCAALTAWNALVEMGRLKVGDTVLVQGTGGVSIFALQIARAMGARVIVTSSSDEKLARARELGAHDGVNYRTQTAWDDAVRKLCPGGVDHVIEVGGAGTLERSMKAVRRSGRISVIGVLSGGGGGGVNPLPMLMRGLTLQGVFVGSRRMFRDMNRALAFAKIRPVVDRTFPLAETRAALEHLQAGKHFGKIVVTL